MTVAELDSLSDESLMKRYGQGNMSAFEILYGRHKAPLFRFVFRQVNDRALSEELYQDVWAKVIAQRSDYHVSSKFTTWLYTIARNRVIDFYRTQGKYSANIDLQDASSAEEDALICDHRPELVLESEKAADHLKKMIADLPADQREAFLLKYEGGFNHRAIAEITGQKEETIKSQVRYALGKLKAGLFGGNHE